MAQTMVHFDALTKRDAWLMIYSLKKKEVVVDVLTKKDVVDYLLTKREMWLYPTKKNVADELSPKKMWLIIYSQNERCGCTQQQKMWPMSCQQKSCG